MTTFHILGLDIPINFANVIMFGTLAAIAVFMLALFVGDDEESDDE